MTISSRGNKVFVQGEEATVERAKELINELRGLSRKGHVLKPEDIRYAIGNIKAGHEVSIEELYNRGIRVSTKKGLVVPKTSTQAEYVEAISQHDIVIGIGPAGTGKPYLAMAMAVNALLTKQVSRVVLARPAVEAGERLGYLPGDVVEKVTPYLRPLYDALYDMMAPSEANRYIEQGIIEIAPLAFMRGRTLNDSFVILDEAQNTTSEQMKMYLTRLGFKSKTVVTGDITQIDLPMGKMSGLVEAKNLLGGIEGIKIVYFSERDVVRHRLVKKIVQAYEKHERKQQQARKEKPDKKG
ncbi:MAG: PhoH family protein [Nitrospirota bacterium]